MVSLVTAAVALLIALAALKFLEGMVKILLLLIAGLLAVYAFRSIIPGLPSMVAGLL